MPQDVGHSGPVQRAQPLPAVRAEQPVPGQGVQGARHEGVARPHRVDDLGGQRVDRHPPPGQYGQCAVAAPGDEDECRAAW